MRHDDLLREIRDAIRANTAATNALLEQRLLDAHPFYVYDAKTVHPALTPTRPGSAVRTENPTGQEKFLGVTGEEARQMKFPFMDE